MRWKRSAGHHFVKWGFHDSVLTGGWQAWNETLTGELNTLWLLLGAILGKRTAVTYFCARRGGVLKSFSCIGIFGELLTPQSLCPILARFVVGSMAMLWHR
jgi:hypothetical protein